MKVIKNVSQLDTLDIPHEVKAALHHELVTPFNNSIEQTMEFWNESDTFLILLEESDVDSMSDVADDIRYFIEYVTDNPEFVLLFNDTGCNPYILALSIIADSGGGCYLLAPLSSKTTAVTTLSKLIELTH